MYSHRVSDQVFYILAALGAGMRHGYGIIADVTELSQGELVLGAGTLYTALGRLLVEELVLVSKEEKEGGRLRRYYRLTGKGRTQLAAELSRREAIVAQVRRLLPKLSKEAT